MMMKGDLTWGDEHIIQYADDVLYSGTPKTYIILLTSVTPVNSIEKSMVMRTISLLSVSSNKKKNLGLPQNNKDA